MSERSPAGLTFMLGRIPVLVRPAFLVLPLVFGLSAGAAKAVTWLAIVFVSVMVHELGHALAMRSFGYAPAIELHGLGGLTHWNPGERPSALRRLIITFAGPIAGLGLGLAAWLLQRATQGTELNPLAEWSLGQLVWVNFIWSLVNLLPLLPWDGGLIVDAGLEWLTGTARPKTTGAISVAAALGVVGFAAVDFSGRIFIAYFGALGLFHGWRRIQSAAQGKAPAAAWEQVMGGKPKDGEQLALDRLQVAADPSERAQLIEVLAWARLAQGDVPAAKAYVAALEDYTPSVELRARIAAADNDADAVVALLEPALESGELMPTAVPLLVSGLLAVERPGRVVDLCRVLTRDGEATPAGMQSAVHDATTKLFTAGEFRPALEACTLAFEQLGRPVHAINAACCCAQLGRLEDGLHWLTRAVDAGTTDAEAIATDEDLAPLRAHSGYAAVLARVRQQTAPAQAS